MDLLLACLLLFYWRSFAARRATMLRKRRRLMEAQKRLEAVQWRLRRQRILTTFVVAVRGSYHCSYHYRIHAQLQRGSYRCSCTWILANSTSRDNSTIIIILMRCLNNNCTVPCQPGCIEWAGSVRYGCMGRSHCGVYRTVLSQTVLT